MYTVDCGTAKVVKYVRFFNCYFYNYDSFNTEYHPINTRYSKQDVALQQYLNDHNIKETSVASCARKELEASCGKKVFRPTFNRDEVEPELLILLKKKVQNPAIIAAPFVGHVDKAYGYDINSMYPAILSEIDYLPSMVNAYQATNSLPKKVPEHYMALNINWQTGDIDVALPGDFYYNSSWLIPPESRPNPLKPFMLEKYQQKRKLKAEGGVKYDFFKMKMNSIIGSFAAKPHTYRFYEHYNDTKYRCSEPLTTVPRYEINVLVTQMAQRKIMKYMEYAESQGCTVLQVNTDGFITNRKIPGIDYSLELGDLRLDKVLTNLDIYEMNRYTSNETVCISGLPKDLYRPGQTVYKFEILQWNGKKWCLIQQTVDLNRRYRTYETR